MHIIKKIYNVAKNHPELISCFCNRDGVAEYSFNIINFTDRDNKFSGIDNIRWIQAGKLYSLGVIAYITPNKVDDLTYIENLAAYYIFKYFYRRNVRAHVSVITK